MATDILVVDDEADIRGLVSGILEDEGHGTRTAGNSDIALAAITARRPSLVFLDIWLQGSRLDGLALLDVIHEQHPELPVVIISGHGNIETAVSAIKRGAYDYIEKPFKADRLVLIATSARLVSRLAIASIALANCASTKPPICATPLDKASNCSVKDFTMCSLISCSLAPGAPGCPGLTSSRSIPCDSFITVL